jgi:uncharacterized membrane protein SirB2
VEKMVTQEDLQPESIIQKTFTVQRKNALTHDSYGALLLKLAGLVFLCMFARMVFVGIAFSFITLLLALICFLLIGFVLLILLEPLSEVQGTRNTLLYGLVMVVLAVLVVII